MRGDRLLHVPLFKRVFTRTGLLALLFVVSISGFPELDGPEQVAQAAALTSYLDALPVVLDEQYVCTLTETSRCMSISRVWLVSVMVVSATHYKGGRADTEAGPYAAV